MENKIYEMLEVLNQLTGHELDEYVDSDNLYENADETPMASISFIKSEISSEMIDLIQNGAVLTEKGLISAEEYISRYTHEFYAFSF